MCRYSFPEGEVIEVTKVERKKVNQMSIVGC